MLQTTSFKKKGKKTDEDEDEEAAKPSTAGQGDPLLAKIDTKKLYQIFAGKFYPLTDLS